VGVPQEWSVMRAGQGSSNDHHGLSLLVREQTPDRPLHGSR
jgi:hypothetical protein